MEILHLFCFNASSILKIVKLLKNGLDVILEFMFFTVFDEYVNERGEIPTVKGQLMASPCS